MSVAGFGRELASFPRALLSQKLAYRVEEGEDAGGGALNMHVQALDQWGGKLLHLKGHISEPLSAAARREPENSVHRQ
jgi:hypothetical protein